MNNQYKIIEFKSVMFVIFLKPLSVDSEISPIIWQTTNKSSWYLRHMPYDHLDRTDNKL